MPPEIKQVRHTKSRLYGITTFYLIGIAVMVLGPLALLTYNFTLKSSIDNLNNQIGILESRKTNQTALISEAAFLEDRLNGVDRYTDTTKWDDVLAQIAAATPTDTQITNIKMTQADNTTKFSLTGNTTDRRSIVLFGDKLNNTKTFTNATIDNILDSTGTTPKTFQFSLSFNLAATK